MCPTTTVVTLEDILEEIVVASIEMRKIGEHFGFEWQADTDITSPGGPITEQLGRIPVRGDTANWEGYRLEVLSATEKRAEKISITPRKQ